MSYTERFLDFLHSLPDPLIYLILGLSAFVENLFPPIPGDTITAFGAFLVGTKRIDFLGVYVSTTFGSLCGFMSLFWLGSVLGRGFFLQGDFWLFKARDILRAEEWFRRYGYLLILLNRFFPGIRSVISIAGGISKLRFFPSMWLALLSAGAWNLIWISLGYALGRNWETVRERMDHIMSRYNQVVFVLLALVVVFFVIRRLMRRRGE